VGLIDAALSPVRAVLGVAEREVEQHSPLQAIEEIDDKILEAVQAVKRATESIERHVEVVESLAETLPALTASVTRLTDQLGDILPLLAPLAAVERDVQRIEGIFHRRRKDSPQT
jgi:hypothetical protein